MPAVTTRTVDPDEAGMRLDRWLREHFPAVSFGHAQKLIRSGQVRVDGGRAKTNTRLEAGQSIRIPPMTDEPGERAANGDGEREERAPRAGSRGETEGGQSDGRVTERKGKASAGKPRSDTELLRAMTLYEDNEVLVLNKPAGLAVQGGSGLSRHVDAMLEALRDSKGVKPRLVHRLDRETSGVLIVAKTRQAAQRLAAAFRARATRKIYWALVKGVPKPHQGRISTWLAREEEAERMRVARHGEEDASHAVSLYSVVEHAGQQLAWLSMRPVTGRTHQLRAHAAHIGHPIVGDPKYFEADSNWDFPGGMQNRLHLHARRIVIPHPNGGTIDVTAPLPDHMRQSWNLLGFDMAAGEAATEAEDA